MKKANLLIKLIYRDTHPTLDTSIYAYIFHTITSTKKLSKQTLSLFQMEMAKSSNEANEGALTQWWCKFKAMPKKLKSKIIEVGRKGKKLGEDDPRRIIHSFKVGLAITLVSLLYYFNPLYEGFGVSAMWAVMTVVVIFEFSVGNFFFTKKYIFYITVNYI